MTFSDLQSLLYSEQQPITLTSTLATVTTNDAAANSNYISLSAVKELIRHYPQSRFVVPHLASPNDILFYSAYGASGATHSRLWCQSNSHDYCPLVISFMLLVIFLTLLFILCLCYSKEVVKPAWVVELTSCIKRKLRIKSSSRSDLGTSRTSINSVYESTVVSTCEEQGLASLGLVENGGVGGHSSGSNSFFNRLNNFSFISNSRLAQNVWFTDISKYHTGADSALPPPPPSYEESQLMISITKPISSFNRVIRTYPRKVSNKRPIIMTGGCNSSRVNTGFVVDSVGSAASSIQQQLPHVSCITVTVDRPCTSSSLATQHSQMTLERIGRRLLEQNQHRVRQDDSGVVSEVDIPPAYETVISENSI